MKIPNLQKIRETIQGQIIAESLAGQSNGNTQQLHNGMAVVPESTLWALVQWMQEVQLPKIEQHRGKDSIEYKNYTGIRDAVIWSLYIAGQYENLLAKNTRDRQLLGYYVEANARLEKELLKYTTIEELLTSDAIEVFKQSIVSRALDILNVKKQNDEKK